ncbi:MAG: hypothetical protein NWF09_07450, partial [Candidatus Bathyarchaeota archaeon]|nr:hypothetical protein [Candidatus Bathyarchaeota archaeon]
LNRPVALLNRNCFACIEIGVKNASAMLRRQFRKRIHNMSRLLRNKPTDSYCLLLLIHTADYC